MLRARVCQTGERREMPKGLVGKPGGTSNFGKPKCGWDDIIRVDIKGTREI